MSVQTRTNALQNEYVRLYCRFINDGVLSNPSGQPLVEIIDTDGVTVLSTAYAQIQNSGVFYADWFVPANLPLGEYYDKWTFQWNSNSSVEEITMVFSVFSLESYINFLNRGRTYKISNRANQLMTDLANNFIYEAQHIPIYWEQGRRIRQEDQQKRRKNYYYFTLDGNNYSAAQGDVYFNNGQKFTVFQTLEENSSSSSSSNERSDSSDSIYSSASSLSSVSSESSSSSRDSSSTTTSSSTSQDIWHPTDETYVEQQVLTMVGTGDPSPTGSLVKVEGSGSTPIGYTVVAKKESMFSTIYDFAYHNWNMDPRPIIRRNNNRIVDDGWHADYEGKIYMDGLMAPEDYINVSYNFAYFSEEELLSFLKFGLQMMNAIPPASEQFASLETAPLAWDAGILLWAAITALKRLVFGLNFQEVMLIFGGPDNINSEDAARAAQQSMQGMYKDYTELWAEFAKNVKTRKLPGSAIYVTPEYTLPGGRSRWFRYLYKTNA